MVLARARPDSQRQGLTCWDAAQAAGLYWTDGQRPVAAVERLVTAELGKLPHGGMTHVYQAAVAAGVAEKRGAAQPDPRPSPPVA